MVWFDLDYFKARTLKQKDNHLAKGLLLYFNVSIYLLNDSCRDRVNAFHWMSKSWHDSDIVHLIQNREYFSFVTIWNKTFLVRELVCGDLFALYILNNKVFGETAVFDNAYKMFKTPYLNNYNSLHIPVTAGVTPIQ